MEESDARWRKKEERVARNRKDEAKTQPECGKRPHENDHAGGSEYSIRLKEERSSSCEIGMGPATATCARSITNPYLGTYVQRKRKLAPYGSVGEWLVNEQQLQAELSSHCRKLRV